VSRDVLRRAWRALEVPAVVIGYALVALAVNAVLAFWLLALISRVGIGGGPTE
jgi:hypothetical protein